MCPNVSISDFRSYFHNRAMATVNSVIDSLCIASVQRYIAVREIDRETKREAEKEMN